MVSAEDPKKKDEQDDPVSVQSNPPPDEAPEAPEKMNTPPEGESPPIGEPEKPSPPQDKQIPEDKQVLEDKQLLELKPGDTIGVYRIEKMIGRGGMATVYKALDVPKQRTVAVKVLKKRFSSSLKALARFDREFMALESLDHPNIVHVLDKGIEGGNNYFVMEFVDGASLARLLRYRKLTLNTKAQILLQAAAALDYAHKKGIVHRDIKPDNILIDRTGRVKIADFGIAQITRSRLPLTSITVTSSYMGTADYMAPEQRADARSVDHRADIFSYGVMLYETFTGRLPLGSFALPSQVNPELSKRTDAIILRALRQDPAERYQSMAELAEDLKREIQPSGLGRLKARMSLILQTESWRRLLSLRAIAATSLLAVIVACLMWLFSVLGQPMPTPGTGMEEAANSSSETVPESSSVQPRNVLENMILVPAGEFTMGSEGEFNNERPMHKVFLNAYYIDKFEVSNAQYKEFVDATGYPVPYVNAFWAEPFNWRNKTYPPGKGDHPVVLVSWYDAAAYAKWAEKRLPTEAEWEKAARGTSGRTWPWGNTWEVDNCNMRESFINSTVPVYQFERGKSPYGCLNMAGNVMEWVADWYLENYYSRSPAKNPTGPVSGVSKVARGGAWDSNINLYTRTGYRAYFMPTEKTATLGFRCAKDVATE